MRIYGTCLCIEAVSRLLKIAVTNNIISFTHNKDLSGVLYDAFGYIGNYSLAVAVDIVGLLYLTFFIKESRVQSNERLVDDNRFSYSLRL